MDSDWDSSDIKPGELALPGDWDLNIQVTQADGVKCPRCWKIHPVRVNFDNLCDRCVDAILKDHPTHESVPHIKAALKAQQERWGIYPKQCDKCHQDNGICCVMYCMYSRSTKRVCKPCKDKYPDSYCHCCMQELPK